MKLTDNWFTSLSEGKNGQLVFVTGRLELEEFMQSKKLRVRVEIKWPYSADEVGMPDESTGALIAEIEPKLRRIMERDKLAILTGNYTGAGEKYWVFYTRHLPSFGERLNECLAPYETLPLEILCEEDPDWEEYLDLLSLNTPDIE
ncbi:DUF695 domain-containing protein [Porphyromonas sp. COT-239 OH1446]|uniref:DUF695 domain-containing protein n=1 Tax=Porphyromonas sp. COT-239 OH1446 TaxID=1515613 RepID=UPI00052D1C56|nr:DUF695 domain-containing protein [Porphyromonas sp. COT-239 OH1446]KGN70162.1 hypothetical protein HQ37_03690 [Porphyromonas sp. COT-239 OH1446]